MFFVNSILTNIFLKYNLFVKKIKESFFTKEKKRRRICNMKKSIQYKWLATASVKQNVSYGYEQYNKDERKSEAIG